VLATVLLTIDLLFVAANLTKLAHGAWIQLVIAGIAFTVMTTWQRGREVVAARRAGAMCGSVFHVAEALGLGNGGVAHVFGA
jgi:KUP system potassium uptake protein